MYWKEKTGQYSSGESLILGKYAVAEYHWDACAPRGSKERYAVTTALPGLKSSLGNYETIEQAKARAELVIKHWIQGAKLLDMSGDVENGDVTNLQEKGD